MNMNRFQQKLLSLIMGVLFILSMLFVGREAASHVMGQSSVVEEGVCVVLDAGHGKAERRPNKFGLARE